MGKGIIALILEALLFLFFYTLNPQLHSRSATYKRGMDF